MHKFVTRKLSLCPCTRTSCARRENWQTVLNFSDLCSARRGLRIFPRLQKNIAKYYSWTVRSLNDPLSYNTQENAIIYFIVFRHSRRLFDKMLLFSRRVFLCTILLYIYVCPTGAKRKIIYRRLSTSIILLV